MKRHNCNSRRGYVLIVVLLVISLLAVVLLEFSYEARINLEAADNYRKGRQALSCAQAGVGTFLAALQRDDEEEREEALHLLLSEGMEFEVGEGSCTVAVEEENGKINVNMLKTAEGKIRRRRTDQFLRLIDLLNLRRGEGSVISYELAPAIMDWADPDEEVTVLPFVQRENEGAETDHYEGLPRPYPCKNAPVEAVRELLWVKGMEREFFEGGPDEESSEEEAVGMRDLLTVYGDGKIDVNHAPSLVIQSLSEKINAALADAVMEARADEPFEEIEELRTVSGMTRPLLKQIEPLITVKPARRYFLVTSVGTVGGLSRTLEVTVSCTKDNVLPIMRKETWGPPVEQRG